jgi:hypothetical protein
MMRGRYHWNQRVTVLNHFAGGTNPADPMGDPLPSGWKPDPERSSVIAFIESMDRESIVRAGLDTTQEHWFIRIEPGNRLTQQGNRIRWHSAEGDLDLSIVTVNAIPGEDIELTITRA